MAGQPWTAPLKDTAHALMGYPALIPAEPFHFDHSEVSPMTNKSPEVRKSLLERMA